MSIEVWRDLIDLLDDTYTLLKPGDKVRWVTMKAWAEVNKGRVSGIDEQIKSNVIIVLDRVRQYLPTVYLSVFADAIRFVEKLNNDYGWNMLETQAGCTLWGHHWYADNPSIPARCWGKPYDPSPGLCERQTDEMICYMAGCYWYFGSCHGYPLPPDGEDPRLPEPRPPEEIPEPRPPEPRPEPTPKPPTIGCEAINLQTTCLAAGCYWRDGSCHTNTRDPILDPKNPFAELATELDVFCNTIPNTRPLQKAACNQLKSMFELMGEFIAWSEKR